MFGIHIVQFSASLYKPHSPWHQMTWVKVQPVKWKIQNCSSGRPWFDSWSWYDLSQLSVTPAPGDQVPGTPFWTPQAPDKHVVHRHTCLCRQTTHAHENKQYIILKIWICSHCQGPCLGLGPTGAGVCVRVKVLYFHQSLHRSQGLGLKPKALVVSGGYAACHQSSPNLSGQCVHPEPGCCLGPSCCQRSCLGSLVQLHWGFVSVAFVTSGDQRNLV